MRCSNACAASTIRGLAVVSGVCLSLCLAALPCLAQSSSSQSTGQGSAGPMTPGLPPGGGGVPGGAAMADFDTLMNLIQQTIDPESWLAAGGTSTILPYPSGVYVDPKGHMQRVREDADLSQSVFAGAGRSHHPWRSESAVRTVSLRALDEAISQAATSGLNPSAELLQLAGLSRIEYVRIDSANEDVLLAGPAGESGMGFHLQDLAVVAALVNSQTTPLGCSIEPSDAGILAAQAVLDQPGATERLSRNPKLLVEQLQQKIGAHHVHVFGMEARTATAMALIDADEHMKKVGFGTVSLRHPVKSYFDYLDEQTSVPAQSLIRWWFAYDDAPIRVNASGDLFQLPERCVKVLSEQQWISLTGRAATGQQDPAADSFAAGFSAELAQLRATHESYARLCGVFESALALQLALESTGQPSLQAWFPNLCRLGDVHGRGEDAVAPQTVAGLTTSHKLKNGTVLAVVSGGVKIAPLDLAARERWQTSQFLVVSVVPTQPEVPSLSHQRWWWD